MNDVLFILLGWLLGTLNPGIVAAIARPKRRAEFLVALKSELVELRYKAALVTDRMRGRTATMSEATLAITARVVRGYHGSASDASFKDSFEKLLARGPALYVAASNQLKDKGSPFPVPYGLPFLESRLGDVGLFDSATQERIHRIRSEHDLFNEQVAQVRMFHDRSFTLTGDNYRVNHDNYESSLLTLAERGERLIHSIDVVVGDE